MCNSVFKGDFVYKISKWDWAIKQFVSADVEFREKQYVVKFLRYTLTPNSFSSIKD